MDKTITKEHVLKLLDIQTSLLWSQRRRKVTTINKLADKGYKLMIQLGFTEDEIEAHLKQ